MSVLSCNVIRNLCTNPKVPTMITPFEERGVVNGKSYGLSVAGYDIRIAEDHVFDERSKFQLGSSIERFKIPKGFIGFVKDKSTWARLGFSVFNTVIEPGWEGFLTLEIVYHGDQMGRVIHAGDPIAQVVFDYVDNPGEGYQGKYQHQEAGPQPARWEEIGDEAKVPQ